MRTHFSISRQTYKDNNTIQHVRYKQPGKLKTTDKYLTL